MCCLPGPEESRKWSIVLRHGLRNVLIPAMTLQFASISEIIGGSVLVEQVFSYPGLGQAAVTAGLGSDVPLLLGITVVSGGYWQLSGNLAASVLYGIGGSQDPEKERPDERYEEKRKREEAGEPPHGFPWDVLLAASVLFLLLVAVLCGHVWQDAASVTDFSRKNLPPCAGYLFGTDWMGRDMFVRTVAGLSMSIRLGLLTAAVSAVIAFLLGLSAAGPGTGSGRACDPSD